MKRDVIVRVLHKVLLRYSGGVSSHVGSKCLCFYLLYKQQSVAESTAAGRAALFYPGYSVC